jgi:hypothetical protein
MLRVSPRMHPSGSGGLESERTTMGNVAVAEELAGSDELDELYRLDASEPEPEPEPETDEDQGDTGEGDEESAPEAMPHG